jgi:hypothetical protein
MLTFDATERTALASTTPTVVLTTRELLPTSSMVVAGGVGAGDCAAVPGGGALDGEGGTEGEGGDAGGLNEDAVAEGSVGADAE